MRQALQRTDWRVLASALGIAAAAVLVWFLAPLIDIAGNAPLAAPHARLFAVAALLALASAVMLAQRTLALNRNRRFLAQLAHSEPGQREVAFLGKRFDQALQQLRSLHLSRRGGARWLAALLGRPLVHELPWYVIIGAPGAGKTTVLLNSGLHFPLAEGSGSESIRGVGGTRNCDWWFASEAVLIDTAGRYTTQDSDREADRTAWLGFLDLLRRHRPRCPINGVLLTLSASDLLHTTPERAAAHAADLRQRLDEITARLGIAVPVYVLVTKTDLLPGFTDFFADFDAQVRSQVWGATLPRGAGSAQWRAEMDALEARLHEQMHEALSRERGASRNAALHAFPAQWRQLNRAALEWLHAVVTVGQGTRPMLRGLYFTSATQDATPSARGSSGNSYFVTRLLRDVVFPESGLAGSASRRSQQRRWALHGALAASALAVVVAAGLTWRGYAQQTRAVDAFAAQLPQLDQALAQAQRNADLVALVPALDALAGSGLDAAHDGDDITLHLLGRQRMLAAAADDSYQRLLKDAFLPRIAARLEAKLRQNAGEPAARTYETLRAYLMLFGGKHFDAAALRAYFANDWQATLPENTSAAERAALLRHLDQLLDGGEVGAPSHADAGLVAAARARVQGVSLAQRAATRLRQQDGNTPRVTLGANAVLVRASGGTLADLPSPRNAALPRERTQQVLVELAQEQSWVLGVPRAQAAAPGLAEEVERLVALDNAVFWQTMLDDLRLAPAPQLGDSARLARALAQPDSPLLTLLRAATRDTAAGTSAAWFAALRAQVDGPQPPIARTQALLVKLAAYLAAADEAAKNRTMPPASDVLRELAQTAHDAPAPLNVLLTQLHGSASNQLLAALREPLSREVARELAPACTRAVSQRYPFVRGATEEMSRDEFARTFGAGGLFDSFYQRHLAAHADAVRSDGAAPFRRAQAIRDAFFRDNGRALGTRLEFRLLELDAGATEFTLDVDGQVLRFKRGTTQPQSIDWLTLGGSTGRVTVLLAPSAGNGYTFNGPWALLRLLDRARVERGASPERALVSFDIEGRKARFEVRSAGAHNPLLRQDLEPFQCPNKL